MLRVIVPHEAMVIRLYSQDEWSEALCQYCIDIKPRVHPSFEYENISRSASRNPSPHMDLCRVLHLGFWSAFHPSLFIGKAERRIRKELNCTFISENTVRKVVANDPVADHQASAEIQPLLLIGEPDKLAVFRATPGPPEPPPTSLDGAQRFLYAMFILENPLNINRTQLIVA